MIIRNKHEFQEIIVTNKHYEQIKLKPGDQCEVEDAQGRGYLANYSNIFEKLDTGVQEDDYKNQEIATLRKQVETLTKLVNRMSKGEVSDIENDEEEFVNDAVKEDSEKEEKQLLIEQLKSAGVKGV